MIYHSEKYKNTIEGLSSEIPVNHGRFLVTGASGLVGSCIVDALLSANRKDKKDFEIYALGRDADKLLNRFGNNTDIHCIQQSITEPIMIEDLDYIIHAASNADPRSYALYPVETILTNVLGAKNVLEYCNNTKRTRVLLTSTFEVYGKLEHEKYEEDEYGLIDLNLIRSCYPESKRTAEMLFRSYYDEYGVDCVIARLSSIYGPTMKMNDSKAHAQFLRKALAGEDIILKSEGTQRRTYCYVIDAVSGIFTVLFKGQAGEAYNIGNNKSIATIAELARIIAGIVGTNIIFDLPDDIERKGFSRPQDCVLIPNKINKLGWEGKYDLASGIKETLEILFESNINI